jgi:hypothetical protein
MTVDCANPSGANLEQQQPAELSPPWQDCILAIKDNRHPVRLIEARAPTLQTRLSGKLLLTCVDVGRRCLATQEAL